MSFYKMVDDVVDLGRWVKRRLLRLRSDSGRRRA